jgi:hypothetical protein
MSAILGRKASRMQKQMMLEWNDLKVLMKFKLGASQFA